MLNKGINIQRTIKKDVIKHLQPNKVVVIYGPRQVGKTTLVKEILQGVKEDVLFVSGEDKSVHPWLSSQSNSILQENIGNKKLLVIDEAQKIYQIGLNLKIMVDMIPGIKIITTGSSSFKLANQVGEPLVGRRWEYFLYPISQMELTPYENLFETKALLPSRLIYGSYPEVITTSDQHEKIRILKSVVDNHLYSDLLEFEGIRKSYKIIQLLRLIALQIGFEVSLNEVGGQLGLNTRTVERYLDLLEKAFVLKRVHGFSRNLRKEVTKSARFYFYDNGIRNAILNSFNSLELRSDVGQLWENYLFIERLKVQEYKHLYRNNYFWRTYDQQEIDLVEEYEGVLHGYEFKWGSKNAKCPKSWSSTYPKSTFKTINRDNYLSFIINEK
ncbi:hypothetical protein COY90_00630 [Candidatus Roizmanbacteria bacterium CG_4_10_14_0_8_um_filter_39_9]|uniref:AAA+ ATPase domain-containing protein n=1 Tax=Candidatus Roizmanbacteria bacterium CG_4_10_14_0_8_um_filter_39_9 TaxID=1974829 RepID=A0A2M7QF12_9BACT|nr:MAG: hypothetical protein COY90_00630 [Candidatus Roizmanbacteria bacterium CG_4_10_14_0_8_um_filter_39_9]